MAIKSKLTRSPLIDCMNVQMLSESTKLQNTVSGINPFPCEIKSESRNPSLWICMGRERFVWVETHKPLAQLAWKGGCQGEMPAFLCRFPHSWTGYRETVLHSAVEIGRWGSKTWSSNKSLEQMVEEDSVHISCGWMLTLWRSTPVGSKLTTDTNNRLASLRTYHIQIWLSALHTSCPSVFTTAPWGIISYYR